MFQKTSSGVVFNNSSGSLASIGEEAEEQRKPPEPAHFDSSATLGSSPSTSQTNLALPKAAEGEDAPTPAKHKWFRPLFPKLYKDDKKQRALSPLANATSMTVNAVMHLEPDVDRAKQSRKAHSAGRSRTKDTPLLKRLMMRKGKAASSAVAPTSEPGRKQKLADHRVARGESEESIDWESEDAEKRFNNKYRVRLIASGADNQDADIVLPF